MKLPSKTKLSIAPDPDPLFRFERESPLAGGGRQFVLIAVTRKTIGWSTATGAGMLGAYHILDAALTFAKRLLLP